MQTILITGANRGIGFEMARQYAAAGDWHVHACCREPDGAEDLARLSRESSDRLLVHQLDVTRTDQIRKLAARLKDASVDILLNNAGVMGPQGERLGSVDEQEWIEVLRANTIAPLKMIEAFLEQVARSRRRIVATISSKMGSIDDNTSGGRFPYRTSKAAVNMVMKGLAVDLKPRGIISVTLNPGWVRTRMGGPAAPLAVEQSVKGLRAVLERLTPAESGKFLNHDGEEIPW